MAQDPAEAPDPAAAKPAPGGVPYQLVFHWRPSKDCSLRFLYVVVNSMILVSDRSKADSPVVFRRLPPPDAGKYQVSWVVSAEVPMERIAVEWRDTRSGARREIAFTTTHVARGTPWHGTETISVEPAA